MKYYYVDYWKGKLLEIDLLRYNKYKGKLKGKNRVKNLNELIDEI